MSLQKENQGFQGAVGLMDFAPTQNESLRWISIWGEKSQKFQMKMKDFGGQWG